MRRPAAALLIVGLLAAGAAVAQEKKKDRETKVRDDKDHVAAGGAWIYDDLPRGVEEAKKTGKPLLVVFRCIPCEACAQIDEDVVDRDPIVAKLLDRFVCVRIPKANGMDLSVFQFDFDQSWAAFFLEPDMTILGRYGTRSSRTDSADDVSLEGFAKVMEAALKVHAQQVADPARNTQHGGKNPRDTPKSSRPEELPGLKGKYAASLDWQGKVVPSCLHCHMIPEARRRGFRDEGKSIPDSLLFEWPQPKTVGLAMDPKERTRVRSVTPGSLAEKAGFLAGDEIWYFAQYEALSVADLQWRLHCAEDGDRVPVSVWRAADGEHRSVDLTLALPDGWRRADDLSWRASTWDLRRMTTGGMLLEDLPDGEREKLGLDKTSMALVAKHVGQYGDHAAAKKAGFVKGDVLVSVAGKTDRMRETDLIWTLATRLHPPGDEVPVTVLRDGKKLELTLPMQ